MHSSFFSMLRTLLFAAALLQCHIAMSGDPLFFELPEDVRSQAFVEWRAEWNAEELRPKIVYAMQGCLGGFFSVPSRACADNSKNWKSCTQFYYNLIGWRELVVHFENSAMVYDYDVAGPSFQECLQAISQNETVTTFGGEDLPFTEDIANEYSGIPSLRELQLTQSYHYGLEDIFFDDSDYPLLVKIESLESLQISGYKITGAGISVLSELPNLQSLSLYETSIGDDAMKEISQIKTLETLDLSYSPVTAVGLRELENLPHLRSLTITWIDPSTVDALLNCPNLEELRLIDSDISTEDVDAVGRLNSLQALTLGGDWTEDRLLELLPKMQELRELRIRSWNPLDNRALLAASRCLNLERLAILRVEGVTTEGLTALQNLERLTALELIGPWDYGINKDGRQEFIYPWAITPEMLEAIGNISQLKELQFADVDVRPGVFSEISKMRNLRRLTLPLDEKNMEELEVLGQLSNLEELTVSWYWPMESVEQITTVLSELDALKVLNIGNSRISSDGLRSIHTTLPNASVLRYQNFVD
jgi:Leucine-rich repeat (LRR) protein